ncbi:MAG: porin [Rubrivivax sp.]
MKKSVLALAVLGSFAGVAAAQGSVTLFGVVDLNVRMVDNNERSYSLSQDGMASSRLGFRGVEDLGGGLKASFWLEGALGPDTGTGTSSYGNGDRANGAYVFQRRSTVSLSNRWGELRLGRDYTPQFWSWTVFDPFGTNGVGSALNLAVLANAVQGSGGAYGTLVRANNMVQYILPNGVFGPGLYGQLSVAAGEGAVANKMFGGRIGYAAGPFNVAAAYSDTDVSIDGNVTASNWNVAGSWDFKFLKLSAFYSQIEVDGFVGGTAGQDNWYVGLSAPLGQANLKASWGQVDGTGQSSSYGAKQWAVGADYNLSKRTAMYVTLSSINNNSASNFRIAAQGALSAGQSSTGGEVGVRHSF